MHDRFLRACRREPTDTTPVWFMRQAGRYLPEYRKLRERHPFLELCRTPDLATAITMQPLRLGFDAAILFADILLILEPMGAPFSFTEERGPVVHEPVRTIAAIDQLRSFEPAEHLGHVLETVRALRGELDGRVPLIGFAGAPFTIASYLIEGGRSADFRRTKELMWGEPDHWRRLMAMIAEVTRRYLRAQIEAGAQAVQLFDSWVGALGREDYERHVQPHTRTILEDPLLATVPVIHFALGGTHLLEAQRAAGGTVMGVDWRLPLDEAWRRVGHDCAIQGNLDPLLLLAPPAIAVERARGLVESVRGQHGHIFNLGHGILPETPVDTVRAVVDAVHEAGTRPASS